MEGAGYGLLVGCGGGALLGLIAYETDSEMSWLTTRGEAAWHFGTFFGLIGATVGGIYSLIAGTDKTIQIEGMSDLEIKEALDKLRKKARIRDYK